jgi:hypothetical protein
LQSGHFDGLAFIFTEDDPYCGIDLDGCRDPMSSEIAPTKKAIIEEVESYSEVSTSGTGIHIIARASVPEGRKVDGIEIYSSRRCFVMTGQHLEGMPLTIEDRNDVINELWNELTAQQGRLGAKAAIIDPDVIDWNADPESIRGWVDETIASDPQFRRTWEHSRPDLNDQSMSAYDLALASQAVWNYACADPTKLYLLIRLHRDKHGNGKQKKKAMRRDYLCRTIGMALAGLGDEDEEEAARTKTSLSIRVGRGRLASATRKAATVLGLVTDADPFNGVYRRGNALVQPTRMADESELDHDGVQRGRLAINPLDVCGLRLALSEACPWEQYDGRSKAYVPTDPPIEVARSLVARATTWSNIPILAGVVETPMLRPDGSVFDQPGYDPRTGLLFDPGGVDFPPIPDEPTRDDALAALETVMDVLSDFPFVNEASLAVALSGLMTPFIRRACPIVPLHVYTAGMMGSGKSALASIPSYIATGRPPPMMSQADPTEEKKRTLALLMSGRSIIVYDNLVDELKSSALSIALTSETYSGRVLGVSEMADPRSMASFYVTGNNAVLSEDLTTRALICALDPDCERPERRKFKIDDLRKEVPERRGKLASAILTMVRGYLAAGEPEGKVPSSRFRHHDRLVRRVLIWLGLADPWESIKLIEARDPVTQRLGALVTAWYDVWGSKPTKVKDAIREAEREEMPGESAAKIEARARLYEAMDEVCGYRGKLSPGAIGKFIHKYEKRYQNGLRFEEAGKAQHVTQWRVKPASKGQSHALGDVIPKAPPPNKPSDAAVVILKKNGLAPDGVGDDADPDPYPHAGVIVLNGEAAAALASDQAVDSATAYAAAEDGTPGLWAQEIAELKDQL